ncbi:hypothetical protein DRP77_13150 [Candidatus Poribacteria bacterium]|nr:MAG: hypothetical protein DRP77_13150 [Candidatus Poribacteria bacterium]
MAELSLVLSLIALLLSVSKWVYDLLRKPSGIPSRASHLRIEPLARGVNCFVSRGGYTLFFVSFRAYNDSDQRPVTIDRCDLKVRIKGRWRRTKLYEAPQAELFPSLVRNSLPLTIKPSEFIDLFEVFQYDALMSSTEVKIRVECREKDGGIVSYEQKVFHRTDNRPVFDILFRTLGV